MPNLAAMASVHWDSLGPEERPRGVDISFPSHGGERGPELLSVPVDLDHLKRSTVAYRPVHNRHRWVAGEFSRKGCPCFQVSSSSSTKNTRPAGARAARTVAQNRWKLPGGTWEKPVGEEHDFVASVGMPREHIGQNVVDSRIPAGLES